MAIFLLTSQFFANVVLNELDQFVKHTLKVRGYVRYVDNFVLLADDPATLTAWRHEIDAFLRQRLHLELHPDKVVLQRCAQGIDYLGSVIFPHHRLTRQRSVRALRRRLDWFRYLLAPATERPVAGPGRGAWQRWLNDHAAFVAPGVPSPALLQRLLSTINSYYGMFGHARTFRLRKHIYHQEMGTLRRYFLPANKDYTHLVVRKVWLR